MSDSTTMIKALRVLSRDIQSCDGVANACVADAADMIESMSTQLAKANEQLQSVCNHNATQQPEITRLRSELAKANERVRELEQNQLPTENGKNRYGLDVSYFRNVINRELNRPLANHKPDELARVFARLSRTADESVMFEPEFSNKFAIENQIEALESLDLNPNNESEDRIVAVIDEKIEQLRKEQ